MKYDLIVDSEDKFFKQGVEFFYAQKYRDAILKFEKSLKKKPNHISTYINLGFINLSLGQNDLVVKAMDKAIKAGIESSVVWHYRGYALKLLNKFEESIESLNKSYEIDPEDCDTLMLLGNIYRSLEKYEESLAYYDKALIVDPFYDLMHNNKLAVILKLEGKEAVEKQREKIADIYYRKAVEYKNSKKFLASAIFSRKALNFYEYPPAIENLTNVHNEIMDNPKLISKFGFKSYKFNNWPNQGLFLLNMGDVNNLDLYEAQKKLISFTEQNEIPHENLKIIKPNIVALGMGNMLLLAVETAQGIFNKFNLIYNLPFFVIDLNTNKLEAYVPQKGSMKDLLEEYNIERIDFSSWTDSSLIFYNLGPKNVTISEIYERAYILSNHLNVKLELIKMFPQNDKIMAAVEKFLGAFNSFKQSTGIEPIEFAGVPDSIMNQLKKEIGKRL